MAEMPSPTIERAGPRIVEQPVDVLVLRLGPQSLAALPALERALGASLPIEPNRTSGAEPRLLWLAPREWAIVSRARVPGLLERIEAAVEGRLHHVADLSDGWVAFTIAGPGARDLLCAGCSLDLHPRSFATNACARTLLAQMPVLIESGSESGFRLFVDRSLSAAMRAWLADATRHCDDLPATG